MSTSYRNVRNPNTATSARSRECPANGHLKISNRTAQPWGMKDKTTVQLTGRSGMMDKCQHVRGNKCPTGSRRQCPWPQDKRHLCEVSNIGHLVPAASGRTRATLDSSACGAASSGRLRVRVRSRCQRRPRSSAPSCEFPT